MLLRFFQDDTNHKAETIAVLKPFYVNNLVAIPAIEAEAAALRGLVASLDHQLQRLAPRAASPPPEASTGGRP